MPISVPLCQVKNIPFTFATLQWKTEFESPAFCFGSIVTYEYLLPAGWQLNGVTSTGNWLPGGSNVTFTSDASTGGIIQVRPVNTGCGSGNVAGVATSIPIERHSPTFSLSPTTVSITCGIPVIQTFTVDMVGATSCGVTYSWYLGLNNGWLYNGVPAPTTSFTGPASITLTSMATNPTYSDITVTPIINGVPQQSLKAIARFVAPSMGLAGGSNTLCTGISSPFYLYGAPANVSFFWGYNTVLPSYGATVVSVNSPNASSTTISKINSGIIDLVACVTDACNQTYHVTRPNILVGGYVSTEILSGYTLAYPPCYTQGCTTSPVSNTLTSSGPPNYIVYTGTAYTNCTNSLCLYNSGVTTGSWSVNAGSCYWWSASNGNNLQFYPDGNNYVQFRLTVNTSCGTVYYDIHFNPVNYNSVGYYLMAPNPVADEVTVSLDETRLQQMNVVKSSDYEIKEVVIMDKMGQIKFRYPAGKGVRQMRLNISNLSAGYYILRVFNGKIWNNLSFIKL